MRSISLVIGLALALVAGALSFTQRLLGPRGSGAVLLAASSPGKEASNPLGFRAKDPALVVLEVKEVITTSDGHLNVVLLMPKDQEMLVPMFVEQEEAVSIAAELHRDPEAHQRGAGLVGKVASALGGHVSGMTIDEIRSTSFYGTLFLTGALEKEIAVPSSAPAGIAAAMAEHAPIYISRTLLSSAGLTRDELSRMHQSVEPKDHHGEGSGGSGIDPEAGRASGIKL